MDLFEAYPELLEREARALSGRALRLIALSGLVYDDQAFYFEFGRRRYWGETDEGRTIIGLGAARAQPDGVFPPHQVLMRYLRKAWRCEVDIFPAGHAYLLDEEEEVVVLDDADPQTPYMLLMTAPRLGGGPEVPDALVQAVYLMPVQRLRRFFASVELLRIERVGLPHFLDRPRWELSALRSQPWAEMLTDGALPEDAWIRPVLALRSLQTLRTQGALPGFPGP